MSGWIGVGVDGSRYSLAALEWAAHEAADREVCLRIAHVCEVNSESEYSSCVVPGSHILSEAAASAHDLAPRLRVMKRITWGVPAQRLPVLLAGAEMVVVGGRGAGDRARSSELGSTVRGLLHSGLDAQFAVIERSATRRYGRVVLGVDLPHPDHSAVRYALEAAHREGAGVLVVTDLAAGLPGGRGPGRSVDAARSLELKERETELHRWVAVCRARYPRVVVEAAPVVGMGDSALILASRRADLLVLDAAHPGRAMPRDRRAAQTLLVRQVSCPVVLIPHRG